MECSICKGEIEKQLDQDGNVFWDQGNNAEPVNDGRCCGECNMTVVIPTRIGLYASVPINESKAEKWYYRLKESDRIHFRKKYPKNDNETNEDWFQKVWIESGKSIGIKRNKYANN